MRLLDPKIDIVFKMLLTQHPRLLRSVVECVLDCPTPIAQLTVLNPDVERDLASDKGAVLDIRIKLDDGRHIDLEMQCEVRADLRKRILYYWARNYVGELLVGHSHDELRPSISIIWLRDPLLAGERFHSVFSVCEHHDRELFSQDFELHLLELSKLHPQTLDRASRWGRFFRFESEADIEQLALEDPIMAEAKKALEHLSTDPKVVSLARERELAAITWSIYENGARREGREEGRAEGRAEGEAIGAIEAFCEVLGIELLADRRAELASMTIVQLHDKLARIKSDKAW